MRLPLPKTFLAMKRLLRLLSVSYGFALGLSLAGMHFIGERHALTGTILFLPMVGWILPAVFLVFPCVIWDRFLGLLHAGLIAWYALVYMAPGFNDWAERGPGDFTLLSCNLGLNPVDGLKSFVERERPEVIALQEANNRSSELSRAFPDYGLLGIDQFPLLSKYPILAGRSIYLGLTHRREPCAGRYEIDYGGRRIVIFNVHLPTPRSLLETTWNHPQLLLPEVFGREYPELCKFIELGWKNRVEQIDELIGILKEETLPMIVVGDFNMPAQGSSYPKIAEFMLDAFTVRGRGYGFTFPADRDFPQSLFAPWVRLDYQFAGREWSVGYFRLETSRKTQHRAMVARYRLGDAEPVTSGSGDHAGHQETLRLRRDFPGHIVPTSGAAPRAR